MLYKHQIGFVCEDAIEWCQTRVVGSPSSDDWARVTSEIDWPLDRVHLHPKTEQWTIQAPFVNMTSPNQLDANKVSNGGAGGPAVKWEIALARDVKRPQGSSRRRLSDDGIRWKRLLSLKCPSLRFGPRCRKTRFLCSQDLADASDLHPMCCMRRSSEAFLGDPLSA